MTDPVLTRAEEEVAEELANGETCIGIADRLGIKKKTVYAHILSIANKLSQAQLNPHDMKPYQLVSRWAWIREQKKKLSA